MTIFTHTSKTDKEWSKICIQSQKEFAELHGIEHIVMEDLNVHGRSEGWSRFRAMQGFMTSRNMLEIGIWMDSDLMIMNPEFDLKGLLKDFSSDRSQLTICVFPIQDNLDLSLAFLKVCNSGKHLFEYGWEVGQVEALGERRDRFSVELMAILDPISVKPIDPEGILSTWYPQNPIRYYNHRVDSAEGKKGLFTMKKPKEMTEGFRDLYVPGTFAVHLKAKGPQLLKLSEDFLEYKNSLLEGVKESRKIMQDL
jgi:hypothetical protein